MIQTYALTDLNLESRLNWNTAAALADSVFAEEIEKLETDMKYYIGPSRFDRWFYWKSQTKEQVY